MIGIDLTGQQALVTGASRGIGAAIALAFAEAGADVALVARDMAAMTELRLEIERKGRKAAVFAADLREPAAGEAVIRQAVAALGRLDILANSAGATRGGDFLKLSDADWEDGFALKFFGTMRICRAAWPHLVASGGKIVTVVGVGCRTPMKDYPIGGSVNSALLNLMKALADRGRNEGVRVNVINPGYVLTERLTGRLDAGAAKRGTTREAMAAELMASIGIKRFAEPGEIGTLAAYVASPLGAYLEGAAIDIDGGWTRGL